MSIPQSSNAEPNASDEIQGAAKRQEFVADLTQLALLTFSGADAAAFLQGQLTCDVEAVQSKPLTTFGAYCTPQGRALATFLLWEQSGTWHMVLSRSIAAAIRKRLSMFVLRAKVVVDAPQDISILGLACAVDAAAGLIGAAAPALRHLASDGGVTAIGIEDGRWLLLTSQSQAEGLLARLPQQIARVESMAWERRDVLAGIPWVTAAVQDRFVPQMLNLELLGGISFKKGCYTGQEIVARTQHLGKVKRRMYRAHASASAEPGTELYSDDVRGQVNGAVVNAVSSDGGSDVLAVVQIESAERSQVHAGAPDGPALQFLPLPYSLP